MSKDNGNGRILPLNGSRTRLTDNFGRVLKHNATVEEVYQIVAEETAKVHEYYLNQIPPFVAKMTQDALVSYGLITLPVASPIAPDVPRETLDAPNAEVVTEVATVEAVVEGCVSPTSEEQS